jgi:ATP-dependent Lon protease
MQQNVQNQTLPVLPLRDVVFFPQMVAPLFVGREKSIQAIELSSARHDKKIILVSQKEANEADPSAEHLFEVGVLGTVLQILKLPDNTIKILVEAESRVKIDHFVTEGQCLEAQYRLIEEEPMTERQSDVLMRSLFSQFESYVKMNKKIPTEVLSHVSKNEDSAKAVDIISAQLPLKTTEKQNILETLDLRARIERLMSILEAELDLLQVEQRIRANVKKQMEESQRSYYLEKQIEAIQQELGNKGDDILEFKEKIAKSGMPKALQEKAHNELDKLKMMSPMSAEATVSRNYLETLTNLPFKRSRERIQIDQVQDFLDDKHYGLEKVKDRVLEFLAVHKRVKKLKGPILCLVGPPGVGKTTLGRSIAEAISRKYVRVSLGGVRDEAEIRGHRRTYIGAMPGKIIQSVIKSGVKNPLILLDEIDKMASDFRGDPAAAMLEVLDPEQNSTFNDHYLEVDYDLSEVMFLATSNSMQMPPALLDRMEVIHLSGYIEDEKVEIAQRHLLPKMMKSNGVFDDEVSIDREAFLHMIRYYTKEAGVRSLQRQISMICRKVVKKHLLENNASQREITPENMDDYLGVPKYRFGFVEEHDRIGQVHGLAWTSVGGETLTIEAVSLPGKGKTISTGKLGDVMQESIKAALTVVKSRAVDYDLEAQYFENHDVHIHVPEGATPKDGPSAGITMCTALLSAIMNIPVKKDVAMTGEITLRGEVLPIGGVREKLLAAKRANIVTVIIPEENRRELKEIPPYITDDLEIHCVRWIDEVFELALTALPQASSTSVVNLSNMNNSTAN